MFDTIFFLRNPSYREICSRRRFQRVDDLLVSAYANNLQELVIVQTEINAVNTWVVGKRCDESGDKITLIDFSILDECSLGRAAQGRYGTAYAADKIGNFCRSALSDERKSLFGIIFRDSREFFEYRSQEKSF